MDMVIKQALLHTGAPVATAPICGTVLGSWVAVPQLAGTPGLMSAAAAPNSRHNSNVVRVRTSAVTPAAFDAKDDAAIHNYTARKQGRPPRGEPR